MMDSKLASQRQRTPTVRYVLGRHAVDAADLYDIRRVLAHAGHVDLSDLREHDDRLAAHVDALLIAIDESWPHCRAALEAPTPGDMFAATVLAISGRDAGRLSSLFAVAQALVGVRPGFRAAFGWLGREQLQGIVVELLRSDDAFRRSIGLCACRMHRVDPGSALVASLKDQVAFVRADAARLAAELGRDDLDIDVSGAADEEAEFWCAWSSVLLARNDRGLQALSRIALRPGSLSTKARRLTLQAMDVATGHRLLQAAASSENAVHLIHGASVVGDPAYIPWLIRHMKVPATARAAAEAFATISGVDFERLALDRPKPADVSTGPNDDPNDPNVDMDPDEGLPWPDPDKVQAWWDKNGSRFQPGVRYFMGEPVTREHCIEVLKNGYQRQRILAAHYLCLLEPGTPLFNTSAPAWRQKKLLDQMV